FNDIRSFLEATNNMHNGNFVMQVRLTDSLRHKPEFSQVKSTWAILNQFLDSLAGAMTMLSTQLGKLQGRYDVPYIADLIDSTSAAARHMQHIYSQLNGFIVEPDENTIYWVEVSPDSELISLHSAPLNVGLLVQKYLWQAKKSVVMASATLR